METLNNLQGKRKPNPYIISLRQKNYAINVQKTKRNITDAKKKKLNELRRRKNQRYNSY